MVVMVARVQRSKKATYRMGSKNWHGYMMPVRSTDGNTMAFEIECVDQNLMDTGEAYRFILRACQSDRMLQLLKDIRDGEFGTMTLTREERNELEKLIGSAEP